MFTLGLVMSAGGLGCVKLDAHGSLESAAPSDDEN